MLAPALAGVNFVVDIESLEQTGSDSLAVVDKGIAVNPQQGRYFVGQRN